MLGSLVGFRNSRTVIGAWRFSQQQRVQDVSHEQQHSTKTPVKGNHLVTS